jgi:hypothetical protein
MVLAYHQANLKYLGALKVMGEKEEALISSVSEAELRAHPLDDDHYGVKRPYTFACTCGAGTGEHQGESVTDVALVTLSLPLRRQQRRQRALKIQERLATLRVIAGERLNVRKYKRKAYAEEQIRKQVLAQPGGEFIQVDVEGEEGHLTLSWRIDVAAMRQAMVLDGKFLLVTNDRTLSGAEMVARYGEKDKAEKGFRTLKGPIRMRPVFLHKEERIAGLVFVNLLALLVYSVVEMKCRRAGLMITAEAVLKRFAYLAVIPGQDRLHHLRGRECTGAGGAPEPPSAGGGAGGETGLVAGEPGRLTASFARTSYRVAEGVGEDTPAGGSLRSWPAESGKGDVCLQVEEENARGRRDQRLVLSCRRDAPPGLSNCPGYSFSDVKVHFCYLSTQR